MATQIIIDTSVFISWLFSDENSIYTKKVMDGFFGGNYNFIAPALFADEILNVLLKSFSSGRINRQEYQLHFDTIQKYYSLFGLINYQPTFSELEERGNLALQYGLRSYDSQYLYLALKHQSPLATTDKKLIQAARTEKVFLEI